MALGSLTSDAEAVTAFEGYLDEGVATEIDQEVVNDPTPEIIVKPAEELEEIEVEPDEEVVEDEAADEEQSINSLEAIASHFDVETSEVLENIEVDGIDGNPISLGDALNSWREIRVGNDTHRAELDAEYKTFRDQNDKDTSAHAQKLMVLADTMISEIQNQYTDDRMEQLSMDDPKGYADALARKYKINELINNVVSHVGTIADGQESSAKQDYAVLIEQEHGKLLKAKPSWHDIGVRDKEMSAGLSYLDTVGFSKEEVAGMTDHRFLVVIDDARRFRELQTGTDSKRVGELRKRGLKAPSPGMRSQGRAGPGPSQNKQRDAALARLSKTGDTRDAAALMEAHL